MSFEILFDLADLMQPEGWRYPWPVAEHDGMSKMRYIDVWS